MWRLKTQTDNTSLAFCIKRQQSVLKMLLTVPLAVYFAAFLTATTDLAKTAAIKGRLVNMLL
jgi:hypothetical protein